MIILAPPIKKRFIDLFMPTSKVDSLMGSLGSLITKANEEATKKIIEADCELVDIETAGKVVPDFKSDLFTHAGPPIEFDRMCKPMKLAITNLIMFLYLIF